MAWGWTCARPESGQAERPSRAAMWTVLVTERGGRISHYVSEDDVCAPLRGANPHSLCGRTFVPAALTTPPGRVCEDCLRRLNDPPGRGTRRRRRRDRRPSVVSFRRA